MRPAPRRQMSPTRCISPTTPRRRPVGVTPPSSRRWRGCAAWSRTGWGIVRSPGSGSGSRCARPPSTDGGSPQSWRRSSRADRKSTHLNSSHLGNSYAVFCLKKKDEELYNRLTTTATEMQPLLVDVRNGHGTISKLLYVVFFYEEGPPPIKRSYPILAFPH